MPTEKAITPKSDLRTMIESADFKSAVASALPAHLTPDRFVRIAITAMTRTPKLKDCTRESVFQCLLLLSQFGLEPDGRNAHLIPFGNVCQLIIDYKGLVDLAMRSGKVATIHADKICDNDEFEYNKGVVTKHVVNLKEDRGKPYAYYAMVKNKDGSEKFEVMTKADIDGIRKRSRAANNGPWVTDFDEMAKKTVFRRLSKWIQLSPEYREALDYDADAVEDLRFDNAKPVIAKPIIGKLKDKELQEIDTNGSASEPERASTEGEVVAPTSPKKKPAKLALKKKTPSTDARPNEAKLFDRLKVGGFTIEQFNQVALDNEWLKDQHGHLVNHLSHVPDDNLAALIDEENWIVIQEGLEALK